MRPDDERQKSDHQHGKDQRFVTPERLARIVCQNFGDDPERGQNQHVNLRMPEEPEQVLPQKRTPAAADRHRRAIHNQTAWQEKARMRNAIHQLHDDRSLERRKRQQQQKRGDKLRPNKKRQPHPGQPFGAQLNDRGDEIDGAEQRRRDQKNKPDQPERLAVENRIMSWARYPQLPPAAYRKSSRSWPHRRARRN